MKILLYITLPILFIILCHTSYDLPEYKPEPELVSTPAPAWTANASHKHKDDNDNTPINILLLQ